MSHANRPLKVITSKKLMKQWASEMRDNVAENSAFIKRIIIGDVETVQ